MARRMSLFDFFLEIDKKLESAIGRASEEELNTPVYEEILAKKFHVEPIVFDWENKVIIETEQEVPIETGETTQAAAWIYKVKFTGDRRLFQCSWPSDMKLADDHVAFTVTEFNNNPAREADDIISSIKHMAQNVYDKSEDFNTKLPTTIKRLVQDRKNFFLRRRQHKMP